MAGKPGMKGGGGLRPGAGRKPSPRPMEKPPVIIDDRDMLQMLQDIALGIIDATPNQLRAAIAAVQYTHAKKGEGGKKEAKDEAAKSAVSKFAPTIAPLKLVTR